MADNNKYVPQKVSELPDVGTDVSNVWLFGSRTNGGVLQSVKMLASNFLKAVGISQSRSQSTTTVPSSKLFDDELKKITNSVTSISIGGRNYLRNSNNLSLGTQFGATMSKTTNYSVAEWGVTDATRYVISGGTNILKAYIYAGLPLKGEIVTASIYVKNLATAPLTVFSNLGARSVIVQPNEATRVVFDGLQGNGTGQVHFQIRGNVSDTFDFVVMRAQYEKGNVVSDWSPALEDLISTERTQSITTAPSSKLFDDTINGILVGGRNYLLNSDFSKINSDASNWVFGSYTNYSFKNGMACFTVKNSVNQGSRIERTVNLEVGTHILSINAKASSGFDIRSFVNADIVSVDSQSVNDFFTHTAVFNVKTAGAVTIRIYLNDFYPVGHEIYLKNIQIQKGNIKSDWSPALEDWQAQIDTLEARVKQLEGK